MTNSSTKIPQAITQETDLTIHTSPPENKNPPDETIVLRMCPACLAHNVVSKGKQQKTNEMRSECKTCGKQFATLFSENMAKLATQANTYKAQLQKALEIKAHTTFLDERRPNAEDCADEVLRGGDIVRRKLTIIYLTNIKRNRISRVREAIVANTTLAGAQLINLDFAEDDILELFCWQDKRNEIISELSKVKLVQSTYNPASDAAKHENFSKRMEEIHKRKSNTKIMLKRFAYKLARLGIKELTVQMKEINPIEDDAGSSLASLETVDSHDL